MMHLLEPFMSTLIPGSPERGYQLDGFTKETSDMELMHMCSQTRLELKPPFNTSEVTREGLIEHDATLSEEEKIGVEEAFNAMDKALKIPAKGTFGKHHKHVLLLLYILC